MAEPQNAPDMYEELPDVDAGDPAGGGAEAAADEQHDEVDEIAEGADPEGMGHGSAAAEADRR